MSRISLIIDTNLLLLYVVGMTDRRLVEKHKKLKEFTPEDFDLLRNMLESAPEVLVTPNVLTETSNLLGFIEDPARTTLYQTFQSVIRLTVEKYVPSDIASQSKEFLRLGLSDVTLMEIADKSRAILTADGPLCRAAQARGLPAFNFNHIRQDYLFGP